jgi:hypothetical protein
MRIPPYPREDPWGDTPTGKPSNASNASIRLDSLIEVDALPAEDAELAALLDTLRDWFRTYVHARSEHAYTVLALWVMHTHTMSAFFSTPRLLLTSPVPGCGKTTALEHINALSLNPQMASYVTPALMARVVSAQQTTLLLDETDNLLNMKREGIGDLLAVLNSGYKRGGSRPVLSPDKATGGWKVEQMTTYSAVALAGIGDHLPDALQSRTITIELDKALPGQVTDTVWDTLETDALSLKTALGEWAAQHPHLQKPTVQGLHGRDREIWLPLFTVANAANPTWLDAAVRAWQSLTTDAAASHELNPMTQKEQILRDLATLWKDEGNPAHAGAFVSTSRLLSGLEALDPGAWGPEAKYGHLTAKRLGTLLNAYGVRPVRNKEQTQRGYYWADIAAAVGRYVSTSMGKSRRIDGKDGLDAYPEGVPLPGLTALTNEHEGTP